MVVGEGLLSAARFALRVVACGNALSLALKSNLGRSFSSFPAWAEYLIADSFEKFTGLLKVMVVGEGLFVASLLTLRAVACGNVLSLSLESNLSRRFSPFPDECKLSQSHRSYHIAVESDGGGGRIRTFEVDDGRFTVCSLWPLGNPTRGNSNFEVMLEMVVGEGLLSAALLTLRAVACGNVLSLSLESNLSRRFSPFPDECKLSQSHRSYHIAVVNYGGGGRIRTFEVDDGRFTVCSLWPLGNPTTG